MKSCVAIAASMFLWGCEGASSGRGDVPTVVAEVNLEIGVEDGAEEYMFGRIGGLIVDEQQRIYVADALTNVIRVFDSAGEYAFTIGREGAGPGELQAPCCLAFDGKGLLWVRDAVNARYNAYEVGVTGAEFRTSIRMSHGARGYMVPLTFDQTGRLIDVGMQTNEDTGVEIIRLHLDPDGSVVNKVAVAEPPPDSLGVHLVQTGDGGVGSAVFFIHQPYGPHHIVGHSPFGGWVQAVSSHYAIRWVGPDGEFEHSIKRDLMGPRLSDDEHARSEETLRNQVQGLAITVGDLPFGVPGRKTPLAELLFDREGRLWVQLSAADGAVNRAHVYERDGSWIETVEWPRNVSLSTGYIGSGQALGVSRDSLGVERVVRLSW
jgi:hypothetical protein